MIQNQPAKNEDTTPIQNERGKILIVDDIPANLKLLRDALQPEGYEILVATSGKAALRTVESAEVDLVLLDVMMPEMNGYEVCEKLKQHPATADIPVIFVTAKGETESIVQGFEIGGVDYIPKPFEGPEVLARVKTHLEKRQLFKALQQKNDALIAEIARREQAETDRDIAHDERQKADERLSIISQQEANRWGLKEGFVGKSKTVAKILEEVRQLQHVGTTGVLILGESGTGKELVARAIHFGGTRAEGPFIPVNCSAIPSELAESTLFGHLRGAFTGANTSRKGCFELADGGTLFLDEIGDMPQQLQAKLLRTLDDGCFTPIGGTDEKHVDVRVLAATNIDLQTKIGDGVFRSDLYFRLARFTVEVPPLRERREDIPLLSEHFLNTFAKEMGLSHAATLSPVALEALTNYHFPGNIRELKNIIEHALIKSRSGLIQPEHLHFIEVTYPPDVRTETPLSEAPALQGQTAHETQSAPDWPVGAFPQTDEQKIFAYVKEQDSIGNAECRDLLDVDLHRASYLLRKMYRAGLLARTGGHRGARYTLPQNS